MLDRAKLYVQFLVEGVMWNISVKLILIWTSGSGDVALLMGVAEPQICKILVEGIIRNIFVK